MADIAWAGCGRWRQEAGPQRSGSRKAAQATRLLVLLITMAIAQFFPTPPSRAHSPYRSPGPFPGEGLPDQTALETTIEGKNQHRPAEDWWLAQIGAPSAWEQVAGGRSAVVAVVDAGIDADHPDLAGQLWVNPGEVAGNGLDDDNNGCVDDLHGWNMVDDNADLRDNTGHGTSMAGVIAAASDNQGITGVCPSCRIMVVKVTGPGGQAQYHHIAKGIAYAAQNGADVINVSLRGKVNSGTLWKAVNEASRRAVVVSGAGNDGSTSPVYPSAYERVLAVAAVGRDDVKLESSGYGAWVDVAAPGSQIMTSRTGGRYWAKSGTSVSAAVVSGLAGLLRCQHPDWSPEEVRRQIILTAEWVDEANPGLEEQLGSGRVNAEKAFTASLQARPLPEGSPSQEQLGHRVEMEIAFDLDLTS